MVETKLLLRSMVFFVTEIVGKFREAKAKRKMVLFLFVFLLLFVQRAICTPRAEGAFRFSEIGSYKKALHCLLLSLLKMICWNWSLTLLQDILSLPSQIRKCFWPPPPPPPPIPSPTQHTCTTDLKTHIVWTSVQEYSSNRVEWSASILYITYFPQSSEVFP